MPENTIGLLLPLATDLNKTHVQRPMQMNDIYDGTHIPRTLGILQTGESQINT